MCHIWIERLGVKVPANDISITSKIDRMTMKLTTLFQKLKSSSFTKKTWQVSQQYEWNATEEFMQTASFADLMLGYQTGKFDALSGYKDPSIVKEFFANSTERYNHFLEEIAGKARLDVGPCLATPLNQWGGGTESFVIEPLLEKVIKFQKEKFGFSLFDNCIGFNLPAEDTIDHLVNRIDGVIYCRNCIDHSPLWPFILANISKYATKGCYLMIWNDLDHNGSADEGHYDITTETKYFKNLIEALGFEILNEYTDKDRVGVNVGYLAIKR